MRYIIVLALLFYLQHGDAQIDSFSVSSSFVDSCRVYFSLPDSEHVFINIYDKNAVNIKTILEDSFFSPGPHTYFIIDQSLQPDTYIVGFVFGKKNITHTTIKGKPLTSARNAHSRKPLRFSLNTAKDTLNIPINGFKNIYILNISGQVIKYLSSDADSISIADIPSGNYAIRVAAADGTELMYDYLMLKR